MPSAYDNIPKKLKPIFFLKCVYLAAFLVIFLRHEFYFSRKVKMKKSISQILILASFTIWFAACGAVQHFDILIKGGIVIDGLGQPGFLADVGIRGNRIEYIGTKKKTSGSTTIDAAGLVVAPGFIDIHTHCDRGLLSQPDNKNYILQGVTTVIGGNCGGSPLSINDYFEQVKTKSISTNIAVYVGHNTIRQKVMGQEDRAPTAKELSQMENYVDQAMKEGALGLSTGLGYTPGMFSKTEEIIALNKVVGNHNGMYASHIRDQGLGMYESVEEAIRIGREGGTRVQISHLKLSIDKLWGETEQLFQIIEGARIAGIEVYSDEYPYIAASTGLSVIFPAWSLSGGKLKEHLQNPATREKLKKEMFHTGRMKTYRDRDMLSALQIASYRNNPEYEGKTLREILVLRGDEPTLENGAELVMEMQSKGGASCVFFLMDENDVAAIMKFPFNMIGSDGSVVRFERGVPHPRSYGTFPRVLGKYVREDNMLTLEEAINKMTALPAKSLRFNDRGVLAPQKLADIVVFDPKTIKDLATFDSPHQYPTGIEVVIVNGVITVQDGTLTENRGGRAIFGPGKVSSD
jgi:N-acyl-D-amino-acid deacylase